MDCRGERRQPVELFRRTGEAHDRAFLATDGADPDWPIEFKSVARVTLEDERFAPARAGECLALYHFPSCRFSRRVVAVIERLNLDVERRDIHADRRYRDELISARGRSTVPVLRITSGDGAERWMPESREIVRYLETTYGET